MLDRRQIQSLHVEKSKAKLTDERYRQILREVADVASSKDESLGDIEFRAIIKAIQAEAAKRKGWKPGQLVKFRQYAKFCQMSDTEARQMLFKATGQMHEEAEQLDQDDFELVMASLEEMLEGFVSKGHVQIPLGIDLEYWRKRQPNGKITSRQRHEIMGLWVQLQQYIPAPKKTYAWFNGFVKQLFHLAEAPADIGELSRHQGVILVDALKRRIKQEEHNVDAAVPF